MSPGQVVRQPLAAREQASRTLDQRLAVRFQRLAHAYVRLVFAVPPTRRFRRAALARMTRSAIEAYNRLDVEPYLIPFHPEARYEIAPEMAGLGINASDFYVHEGIRRYWEEGRNVWPDLRIDPQELIDLGDQLLMLGKISGKGVRSGIQTSFPYATVATVSNAKVILIREYIDHAEALEAVGLSE